MSPKIALFDIETFPAVALVWGNSKYEQDVIEFKEPWRMASFAYKWLGEGGVKCHALPDFEGDEKALIGKLHSLFCDADILIAHNAKYDVGRALAKFAVYGFEPPSPYKVICTYQIAKKFGFSSRKLDDLGAELQVGRKLPHQGKHTWLGCMEGDRRAWKTMRAYNCHDVDPLLEGVYMRLRPFYQQHPQLTWFTRDHACPTCQSKKIQSRGFVLTKTGRRQRYQCMGCGAWSASIKHEKIC